MVAFDRRQVVSIKVGTDQSGAMSVSTREWFNCGRSEPTVNTEIAPDATIPDNADEGWGNGGRHHGGWGDGDRDRDRDRDRDHDRGDHDGDRDGRRGDRDRDRDGDRDQDG
jgi:hypothetical protein